MKLLSAFLLAVLLVPTFAHADELSESSGELSPTDYFEAIHARWPESYRPIEERLDPERDYLILSLLEPSTPMDLRSAELFRQSLIAKTYINKETIGHTMLAWQCHTASGEMRKGVTAISGELSGQTNLMVRQGWGLTALVSTFTDGYLQVAEDIDNNLSRSRERGLRTWNLVTEIDPADCSRVMEFVRTFVFYPGNPMRNFGLTVDPAKFEGGGCGSFGVAVIDQASLWPKEAIHLLWRELSAPLTFMGRGLNRIAVNANEYQLRSQDPIAKQPHVVNIDRFKMGPWEGEGPRESLHLVDPEMFIFAVKVLNENYLKTLSQEEKVGRQPRGTAKATASWYAFQYPRNRVIHAYVPDSVSAKGYGPYTAQYLRRIPIDAKFDRHTSELQRIMTSWWREHIGAGGTAEMIPFGNSAVLILKKSRPAPGVRISQQTF